MATKKSNGKNALKKTVKKTAKKSVKKTAAVAKKHTGLAVFIVILLVVIVVGLFVGEYYFGWIGLFKGDDGDDGGESGRIPYETDALAIHFLELGNKYAGDCTLIDIGDTEILIDAGSRQGSAATIVPYINQYCEDGVLEYVIATHAHEDHISAFYSTNSIPGIFESFECEVIIDFPLTKKTTTSDLSVYSRYVAARDAEVAAGAKHFTALDCWEGEKAGAQKSYQIAENITLNILYHKFYREYVSGDDENNYSVCVLLTQGTQNFLFTGDLEEAGEESLVDNNVLHKCKLYKAGHHGSKTSSNNVLLQKIQPEIVCVCCCAGTGEYTTEKNNQFPTQDFIDRVGYYTENIYVTSVVSDNAAGFTSMNGNIVVVSNGINVTVTGTNNSTKLKDTAWFKANRKWPSAA